ncbi:unnamed protein product [Owenia fusiformis]|uniref:Uncharacterized protein n=1 Tax=Owenia fusiformis TaxID=6347 RepID=A0A8J1UV99_OWEFU|nr:unnamed protein product [Owenia fusiformis]
MLLFTLLAACLVSYASCDQATDELVAEFESALLAVPEYKWPAEFRQKFNSISNYGGNAEHWCCKNPDNGGMVPPKTLRVKKVATVYQSQERKVKTGYTKCGWMSTNTCSIYALRYFSQAKYMYREELVLAPQACGRAKGTELVCCVGYVEILKNCMDQYWVVDNIDLIKRLQDLQKREKSG